MNLDVEPLKAVNEKEEAKAKYKADVTETNQQKKNIYNFYKEKKHSMKQLAMLDLSID